MLHKGPAESPVACHDVFHVAVKDIVDEAPHQHIAEIMERTLVLLEIGARKAVAYHHVAPFLQHQAAHLAGMVGRIGVIAINHQVAVGIDIPEHGAYHIALALTALIAHLGSRTARYLVGTVGRVVVVYIDGGLGQRSLEVGHYFCNGLALIVARHEHSDFTFVFLHRMGVLDRG